MKSFKVLTASLLTPALIFSSLVSPGILAQEKLIEVVPRFYYLQEAEGQESVYVHVCYGDNPDAENESADSNLGCNRIIEVAAADWEKFIHDLEHNISVARALALVEHKSEQMQATFQVRQYEVRATVDKGSIAGLSSAGVLAMLGMFGLAKSSLFPYTARHGGAIAAMLLGTAVSTLSIIAWDRAIKAEAREFSFPPSSEQGLLAELDRGIVAGTDEEYLELQGEIMQLFTDFLNQYGKPAQAE